MQKNKMRRNYIMPNTGFQRWIIVCFVMAFVVGIPLEVWITYNAWNECRANGYGSYFCLSVLSR